MPAYGGPVAGRNDKHVDEQHAVWDGSVGQEDKRCTISPFETFSDENIRLMMRNDAKR